MEIKITLTEQQAQFLKTFAEKQHPGADDNMMTADAIHVVETASKRFTPYHGDIAGYYDSDDLQFTADEDHEAWYKDVTELVEEEAELSGIISYEEALRLGTIYVGNDEHLVIDEVSYAKAFDVTICGMAWVTDEYQPVAYFFIRDEAVRYLNYQSHNLRKPRVYTHHLGYANHGDLPVFRDLLLQVGTLVKEADPAVTV